MKYVITLLLLFSNSFNSISSSVYSSDNGHIEVVQINKDGDIIWWVIGWIAGEVISSGVEAICSGFGGDPETCSFIGAVAGGLSGMRRSAIRSVSKTKYYRYRGTNRKYTAKYDKEKKRGEVSFKVESADVAEFVASSLASHYFNTNLNGQPYQVPRSQMCKSHSNDRSNSGTWENVTSYKTTKRNKFKGTKMHLGYHFLLTKDDVVDEILSSGEDKISVSWALSHNFGLVQLEGGVRVFSLKNSSNSVESFDLSSGYFEGALTLPIMDYISPNIGGGYSFSNSEVKKDRDTSKNSNSSPYYFFGIDILISDRLFGFGRYLSTISAESYDYNIYELGIKFKFKKS